MRRALHSAYQEAMASHLGKAIAMAEKEASGAAEEVRSDPAWYGTDASRHKRQIQLHLSYGNALITARGEVDRATSLFERAQIRMAAVTHANARALGRQM